jgi:hypothetical protein
MDCDFGRKADADFWKIVLQRYSDEVPGSIRATDLATQAERAATLMTIVSSAIRNDLDVAVYLKDVLDQLLADSTDYASLCPHVWKLTHPEAIRAYRVDERRDAVDRGGRRVGEPSGIGRLERDRDAGRRPQPGG